MIEEEKSDEENSLELKRELKRLNDLANLRGLGISLAVQSAELIGERLAVRGKEAEALRDVNRALEIVTKTALLADAALQSSRSAEIEAQAPFREIVLIILESPLPDSRRRVMLQEIVEQKGEGGHQIVYDALVAATQDSSRADELLQLEA